MTYQSSILFFFYLSYNNHDYPLKPYYSLALFDKPFRCGFKHQHQTISYLSWFCFKNPCSALTELLAAILNKTHNKFFFPSSSVAHLQSPRKTQVSWLSTMTCMSCSDVGWSARCLCCLRRERSGAPQPTVWRSRSLLFACC